MKHLFPLIAGFTLALASCSKESGSTRLKIRMTDAPAELEAVNIDLEAVHIKMASDSGGWFTMAARPGVYNLLDLQNGVDTLIAEGVYPHGEVKEIRLVLGADNSVEADGKVYPLTIPSGSGSGLKIKIGKKLRTAADSLLIDFDAALSVRQENDGYKLRPVIRLK
ncbi:MAG TPA: DUF4382 domain-containing protein [Chitinophagaceae bacterium]|jgi:hypothetical protein|nr:DUF4382 domain-containing protein [Chitinophagaceae bacterium]